jgi:hypothetical protein
LFFPQHLQYLQFALCRFCMLDNCHNTIDFVCQITILIVITKSVYVNFCECCSSWQWAVGSGRLAVVNSKKEAALQTANLKPQTANCPPQTANCKPQTAHRPLLNFISFFR